MIDDRFRNFCGRTRTRMAEYIHHHILVHILIYGIYILYQQAYILLGWYYMMSMRIRLKFRKGPCTAWTKNTDIMSKPRHLRQTLCSGVQSRQKTDDIKQRFQCVKWYHEVERHGIPCAVCDPIGQPHEQRCQHPVAFVERYNRFGALQDPECLRR
jgi:hypothetical protein